ncbi:MAG TPA: cytochrome d ubiquinol oxidase subunit II, partial [Solirubrobacteraceae bacterium]
MHLHTLWFVILAILWVGFFVLEGFDFGVGALHTIVGKTETGRRVALNTIGPFWDGNEVWLIVAGAGTFAAFPAWYATMFSALYLALLVVLAALIARGVAFEFRGKSDDPRWRSTWTWCTTLGSLLIPLLIGVGLGDLLVGLPINSSHDYTGNFFDLLTPYGLWTGLTLLGLCLLHGATFLMLKTTDDVRDRARAISRPLGWIAVGMVVGFVIWTRVVVGHTQVPGPVEVLALIAVIFAARLARSEQHEGWAFTASAAAIAATVGSLFIDLYPNV